MFAVRLKTSHPIGVYHRGGKLFHRIEPVIFDKLPKVIADDPWLVVEEIAPAPEEPAPGSNSSKGSNRSKRLERAPGALEQSEAVERLERERSE